jgi:predicted DNA binding protein
MTLFFHIRNVVPGDNVVVQLNRYKKVNKIFLKKLGQTKSSLPKNLTKYMNNRFCGTVVSNDYANRSLIVSIDTNMYKTSVYQLDLLYTDIKELYKVMAPLSTTSDLEKQLNRQKAHVNSRLEGIFYPEDSIFVKIQIPSN